MKIAIMQPYFLPYIGYYQLINAVDKFVVYDNIKYTKKGWINRNRMLINGRDEYFTLPLKKDSDFLDIKERCLSDNFDEDCTKLLQKIKGAYQKAPYFKETFKLAEEIFFLNNHNLFDFIFNSLNIVCRYLNIDTPLIISSTIEADHSMKSEQKVISICEKLNADIYINPIGGLELYSKEIFRQKNIELKFLKSYPVSYHQFNNEFIPWLSIIDVMMFNSKDHVQEMIMNEFAIINS